jgi:hypothetical protein
VRKALFKKILICFYLLLSTSMLSCVGTVEDKNLASTKTAEKANVVVSFSGLSRVNPTAHDKVELFWFPASGLAENLTYEIYTNSSVVPLSIPAISLLSNSAGELRYTVTSLQINTSYNFSVGVKDITTGASSTSNRTLSAKTFANLTADFQGVSNVRVPAGAAGKTGLIVEWVPAKIDTIALPLPYPQDPVGYEIKYIDKLVGSPADLNDPSKPFVVIRQIPTNINGSTPATDARSATITGLNPGSTYYFQVRAIHKAFVDFGSITSYQREHNTKSFEQTTISNAGVFALSSPLVIVTPPKAGIDQRDKVDLKWFAATGAFDKYRVYWKKVADPDQTVPGVSLAPVDTSVLPDQLTDLYITSTIHPGGEKLNGDIDFGYFNVAADNTFGAVKSLEAYGYYHFKIAACEDGGCTTRTYSDYTPSRVVPVIAPFVGVGSIEHPSDSSFDFKIEVKMDPPIITSGYLDGSEVYCFDGNAGTTPVLLPNDGSAASDPGNSCDGVKLKTPSPASLAGFSNYNNLNLELDTPFSGLETVSSKRYCFAIVPYIDGDYGVNDIYDYPAIVGANTPPRDLSEAVFKCIVPEIKVPTAAQFPGKNLGCSLTGANINVSWNLPSEGIYTNFSVFWKEKNQNNFLFSDAISDLGTNTIYSSSIDTNTATFLSDTDTTYQIQNLIPGKTYEFGVLAFIDGANKKFSESNVRTDSCTIPIPKAEFKEIMNIFAVGPKESGLGTYTNGKLPRLLETIDSDGLPAEVKVDATGVTPLSEFDERFGAIGVSALSVFNGVTGTKDSDPSANPRMKYSDSGIVRFAFKDFLLNDGQTMMQTAVARGDIDASGALLVSKANLKYGYRIYRSDDGKASWTDLTSLDHPSQEPSNIGLVTPMPLSYRKRNNLGAVSYEGVSFVDYSVKNEENSPTDNLISRAKILYYRINPVYDGNELEFVDSASKDHIIKVTLPPPNMALVDRRIANRTLCEEMGKDVLDGFGKPKPFYSCTYNGLGSSGLGVPWQVGNTVYDQGGDLLIDRFELGCNFTRGDGFNQKSIPKAAESASYDFRGLATNGSKLEGCHTNSQLSVGPSNDPLGDAGPFISGDFEVRNGDCLFANTTTRANSVCAPGFNSTGYSTFNGPGIIGSPACDNGGSDVTGSDYFDVYEDVHKVYANNISQSEFAGVALSRQRATGNNTRVQLRWRGGNDKLIIPRDGGVYPSSCHINLPSIAGVDDGTDDTIMDGRMKPRWIPLNFLDKLNYDGGTSFSILDSTVSEVLTDSRLYDTAGSSVTNKNNPPSGSLAVSGSSRFGSSFPLGRIATSNAAKLAPLGMLSQSLSQQICNQYKVEVGVGEGASFVNTEGKINEKRLLRRKEYVAAGSWPRSFDFKKTSEVENGVRVFAPDDVGSALSNDNSSCNSNNKNTGAGQSSASLNVRGFIQSNMPYSNVGTYGVSSDTPTLTGSSLYDGSKAAGLEPSLSKNTQKCQSQFGIQDLVGNFSEYTSDQVFCDFTRDKLMYGTFAFDSDSVELANSTEYLSNASRVIWVRNEADSGSCSVVQEGSIRDNVNTVTGVSFLPPYFSDGSANPGVVLREKTFDKNSVDDSRNGDGVFLDFGSANLSSPLKEHDTLGMVFDTTVRDRAANGSLGDLGQSDPRRSRYFNPALGIPLECNSGGCDQSTDNKAISTEAILCKACSSVMTFDADLNLVVDPSCSCDDPAPLGISISDFPINNSQIYSDGISERVFQTGTTSTRGTAPAIQSTFSFVDLDEGFSPYNLLTVGPVSNDDSIGPEPALQTKTAWWTVARDAAIYFKNGGSSTSTLNGRYTASLLGNSSNSQFNDPQAGTRCVTKFNEEGDY